MGDYRKRICEDNGPGLVLPDIIAERSFELKGYILLMLKDIPFSRKEYKDAFKHIDELKGHCKLIQCSKCAMRIIFT